MKGNCNYKPASRIEYGKTGTGQVLFNIVRNDKEIDGTVAENWDFESVEVSSFKRETIIAAIIRDKYSDDAVEALISNFGIGKEIVEFLRFQNYRDLAKAVADGKSLQSELEEFFSRKITRITLSFTDTLTGGKWEALADYAIKSNMHFSVDVKTNTVEVCANWISSEHLALLQTDASVVIEEIDGI